MHLQFFQNLEVGDDGLEIRIRAGYINITCIGWNMEVRNAELKIWVGSDYIKGTYVSQTF